MRTKPLLKAGYTWDEQTQRPIPRRLKRGRPPGSKNKPKAVAPPDVVETLKAEIDEAVKLQRSEFPDDTEAMLRHRAEMYRTYRYKEGRWADFAAVAETERKEAAAAEIEREKAAAQLGDFPS